MTQSPSSPMRSEQMLPAEEDLEALMRAIQGRHRVKLVYRRQLDGVTSIHEIAPLDIRGGDTSRTANTLYLWAWCFAEQEAEMHLMDRVERVLELDQVFDTDDLLARWPTRRWPLPKSWSVPRDWA
ncbi:MAG TPA: WYL domain-containing protein [Actinomycetota bacterium]